MGPTSYWWNDLVQKFHAGAFPDGLDDGPQLLVGLLEVAWSREDTVDTVRYFFCDTGMNSPAVFYRQALGGVPSVLILSAVLTRANRVALKVTVPSLFRGMFMLIRRFRRHRGAKTFEITAKSRANDSKKGNL